MACSIQLMEDLQDGFLTILILGSFSSVRWKGWT